MRQIILSLAPVLMLAQTYPPGPQVLTFHSDIDDSDQPYAIYVPKHYEAAKKYPLVISLHGEGSNHRLDLRRVFGKGNLPRETDAHAGRDFPQLKDVEFIVASPFARGDMGYQGIPEKDVYDVLGDIKKRFSIDDDRVYLTGVSMGGGGALWLALTHPDMWAAVAAVCPAAAPGIEELSPNALNLPVRLFQGAIDPVVPVQSMRHWNAILQEAGARVEYTEYPRVRHNAWDSAYQDASIFDWLDQFRRNRFPERVRFVTDTYRYASEYWLKIDGLTPGTLAYIEARFDGPNQLAIQTRELLGFSLRLSGHPMYSSAKPLSVTIDGEKMKPGRSLSFSKGERGWQPAPYLIPAGHKRPGAEGPVSEAIAGRQIYVYGTEAADGDAEIKSRHEQARRAANWSAPHEPLALNFKVVSDREVESAPDATLVLFGVKETNAAIARISSRLPLALNASAADYGLLFLYPVDSHFVVVSSGLPWWTNADEIRFPGPSFLPTPYRILLGLGDYVLFRGSLEHVVAAGRFTDDWKIPAPDAAKMKLTSAVEIK